MASGSSKTVSFALERDEQRVIESESEESEADSDFQEYIESLSEGECWSSGDEEHTEFFEQLLEGTRFGSHRSPEKLDPAQRTSLLLFDKDILQERGGENAVIR